MFGTTGLGTTEAKRLQCCAETSLFYLEQADEQEMNGLWEKEKPPERLYRPRHKSYKAAGGFLSSMSSSSVVPPAGQQSSKHLVTQ